MITTLRGHEWQRLKSWIRNLPRPRLERSGIDLARLLATIARRPLPPDVDIDFPLHRDFRMGNLRLSDELVNEALKFCQSEAARALDSEAFHTGDGT